jgi:uncharacterized protein YdhG (YjbR/CyaY superfamily)
MVQLRRAEDGMAKTDYKTVDEYVATFPEDMQSILQTVRRTIREAVPDAEEVISYQVPAYRFHGWVFYFGGYKKHYSLSCPPPFTVFTAFQEALAPYEISKSAIRFPLDQPVPVKLIGDMAKFRADENLSREKQKTK